MKSYEKRRKLLDKQKEKILKKYAGNVTMVVKDEEKLERQKAELRKRGYL